MIEYDVVVIGLGAVGSSAAYHLARRGARVLGIDRYAPPHMLGSTHGRTRIIREAYFEHPLYVPFIRRAYECWAALEAEWNDTLLVQTGGLMIGPSDGTLVSGAVRSAREFDVDHEMLTAAEVRERFPAYDPPDDHVALLEHRAGLLLPERCVEAQITLARRHGATLWSGTEVTRLESDGDGVRVVTSRGRLHAARAVLASGPWMPGILSDMGASLPLTVERQLSHWFAPSSHPDLHGPDRCPLSLWESEPGHFFATFADLGDGVKCGVHHFGEVTDPDRVNRDVAPAETEQARRMLARLMPLAAGDALEGRVCLYTNTPDGDFVIDRLPSAPAVVVGSACSGHGFKFASATGEALADLATDRSPVVDLTAFRFGRFSCGAGGWRVECGGWRLG
jgi:sarcosine oxidase